MTKQDSPTTSVPKLDFVSFAESLGYRKPMYLPQETKTLLSKAMKFAESYGNHRELEGRIDEAEHAANHNNSEYTSDYLEERIIKLQSQKETHNDL